jgi:hypothetical protein
MTKQIREKDLVELTFPLGKNTVAKETDMPEGSARELLNVDLTNTGKPSRRRGFTSVYSGAGIHSLVSTKQHSFFCEGTELKQLLPNFTATSVRTGLDPAVGLSYAEVDGRVYYANGSQKGVITEDAVNAEWGVEAPVGQPNLAVTAAGGLDAGTYQVAITYVSAAGEESGTGRAALLTLPSSGGILISDIPQSSADSCNIYVSPANGDVLYLVKNVPMGTASTTVQSTINFSRMLETQFMEEVPAGHIIRHFKGRMWMAVGDLLVFTPSLRYGLFDPRHTYFRFPGKITIVQPVDDGIFVVSGEKTYFLQGTNPKDMTQKVVYHEGAVEGTGMSVPPKVLKADNDLLAGTDAEDVPEYVAYWFSSAGAVFGFPGGTIKPVTEDRIAVSEYGNGATLLREEGDTRQLITALTNKGDRAGFGAVDTATAEVRRNGVVLT